MPSFEYTLIKRADFALLGEWLSTSHVARWWDDDPSPGAIESGYGGCVDGTEPAEVFIVRCDGAPVGLIQRYRIGAYPQYASDIAGIVELPEDTTSIDYLIGPPNALRKRLGTAMIAAFVARTWQDWPATSSMIVPVHADNRASWRALERAGFVRVAAGELAPDNPIDSRAHYLYQQARFLHK